MPDKLDDFIQLDRTFHDLAMSEEEGTHAELFRLTHRGTLTRWSNLLEERRVLLLSEAGSGKTEEIRHACRALRMSGKHAFFLRIEHLAHEFDSSFEEGTPEEFGDWVSSGEDGWLLLDSVDEARLKDPKDFERAIRRISRKLTDVLQRAHIVITSRSEAWRPKTDLLLCKTNLPWTPPACTPDEDQASDEALTTSVGTGSDRRKNVFRMVALDDLSGEQVDRFAGAKGITDIAAFRKALDRADAWSFTTRPLDLADTVEFWLANGRVGSRYELLRSSIDKRLEERDQDRADANPISKERIREGARLVAAASTLSKESAIRVPDGQQNDRGLDIKEVLNDWNDADCRTLLTRPIFDEGIYGTVRFHHRSVREFLTAEWVHSLLIKEGSRARIETLFFRHQYGVEAVVPTMRPILPWLAILDQRILERAMCLAPEVLFEGGAPAQLPQEARGRILRQACEQLAQPGNGHSVTEYSAVQRFASPDLAGVIRELLQKYKDDDTIVCFLLQMVHCGGIAALADKAKYFALTSRFENTRTAAIRAVLEVATSRDAAEVRQAVVAEAPPLRRSWLATLIEGLDHTPGDVEWLFAALALVAPKRQFEIDLLSRTLANYAAASPPALLSSILDGFGKLLKQRPVIERRHCKISERFSWLGETSGQILLTMIRRRDPATLKKVALTILRTLPIAGNYDRGVSHELGNELIKLVREWPELNRELFWSSVAEERVRRKKKGGGRLTDYWHVSIFASYWAFDHSDFGYMMDQIATRRFTDDKLVAFSIALTLFQQENRPRAWQEQIEKTISSNSKISAEMLQMLKLSDDSAARVKRQQAALKRQSDREAADDATKKYRAKELLSIRVATIRDFGQPGKVSHDQLYLLEQMRSGDSQHNQWTTGNWRSLIETYGDEVSRAFRDGAVGYWRHNTPRLRSEGAVPNSTPVTTIFGLAGLSIEARETNGWPSALTAGEAEIAARYALQELNGFPFWLPQLHKAFPSQVLDVILKEIRHQLLIETAEGDSDYALYDVSWHGHWIWDQIAPALLFEVRTERVNARNLGSLLAIINRSSIDDRTIAAIASRKSNATGNLTFSAIWFATWVGVDPDAAIPALAARFSGMKNTTEQTELALAFVIALVDDSLQGGCPRQAFRTVEHMKSLYLLMARYIRSEDDIERAGQGIYSPGPRDDAQRARNALLAFIRETPGKRAFLSLVGIADAHPDQKIRPWIHFHAKLRAAADADFAAWTPSQVQEFGKSLVATPENHRELWYHAVDRLEALKHDLENGDSSIASILVGVDQETEFRKFIGGWCRDRAAGRYVIPQEEELADAKRPDLRFNGAGFDAPVPAELKVADKWSGPQLFERLEVQLCGDYLRDARSSRGIFLLVYLGTKSSWDLPDGRSIDSFARLIDELQGHWKMIANDYPGIEDVRVIGIDLTRRGIDAKAAKTAKKTRNTGKAEGTQPKHWPAGHKAAYTRRSVESKLDEPVKPKNNSNL